MSRRGRGLVNPAQVEAFKVLRQKQEGRKQFREGEAKSQEANPDPNSRFMSGKIRYSVNGGPETKNNPY